METKSKFRNNLQEMFVVVASGGEHDDAWQSNCVATFDEQLANEYIADRQRQDALFNERNAKLDDYEEQYVQENPRPAIPAVPQAPRWPAGMGKHQITAEMRAERDRINAERSAIFAAHGERQGVWHEGWEIAKHAFLVSLGVAPEDMGEFEYSWLKQRDTSYHIEKIPVIIPN
jgi:hypothetical protein